MRALSYAVGDIFAAEGFVVSVQAQEGLFDAEVLEEKPAVPRVFGGDQVGGFQDFNGPQCDVLAVSDGCGNNA